MRWAANHIFVTIVCINSGFYSKMLHKAGVI